MSMGPEQVQKDKTFDEHHPTLLERSFPKKKIFLKKISCVPALMKIGR